MMDTTRRAFLQRLGLLPLLSMGWGWTVLHPLRPRADQMVRTGVGAYTLIFDPPLQSSHIAVVAYVSTGRLDVRVLELAKETS